MYETRAIICLNTIKVVFYDISMCLVHDTVFKLPVRLAELALLRKDNALLTHLAVHVYKP